MTFLLILPAVLSLLLLGAHFLRDGVVVLVAACAGLCLLLLIARPWVARVVQAALVLGSLEWIRTLVVLALQRQHAGLPWLRMAVILGAVAALALLAAWLFQRPRLAARYGIGAKHEK